MTEMIAENFQLIDGHRFATIELIGIFCTIYVICLFIHSTAHAQFTEGIKRTRNEY